MTDFVELTTRVFRRYLAAVRAGHDVESIRAVLRPFERLHTLYVSGQQRDDLRKALQAADALLDDSYPEDYSWPLQVTDQLGSDPTITFWGEDPIVAWLDRRSKESLFIANPEHHDMRYVRCVHDERFEWYFRPRFATSSLTAPPLPWLTFTARTRDSVRVFAYAFDSIHQSSSSPAIDVFGDTSFNQSATIDHDGRLHVVAQAYRRRQPVVIYRMREPSGRWAPTEIIGADDDLGSCWDPTITVDSHRRVYVVYSRFVAPHYRMVWSTRVAQQQWRSRALSGWPHHVLHPQATWHQSHGLVVACDAVNLPGVGRSGHTEYWRRASDSSSVEAPPEVQSTFSASTSMAVVALGDGDGEIPLIRHDCAGSGVGQFPQITALGNGDLCLAYRVRQPLPLFNWVHDVYFNFWTEGGWTRPQLVTRSDGPPGEVSVVGSRGDSVAIVWQSDDRAEHILNNIGVVDENSHTVSEISAHLRIIAGEAHVHGGYSDAGAIRVAAIRATSALTTRLASPDVETLDSCSLPDLTTQAKSTNSAPRMSDRDQRRSGRRLYWGDLHRHSNVSRCASGLDLEPLDHFKLAQDIGRYDFWSLTDHAENTTETTHKTLNKLASIFTCDGLHVCLPGFEWTSWEHGHLNVIFFDGPGPLLGANHPQSRTPHQVWDKLDGRRALTIPHHPAHNTFPTDWEAFDDRFVRVAEVFQAATGSYESPWCFRQDVAAIRHDSSIKAALDRGLRFGLIGSTDHGYGSAYVGVYADDLTDRALFDAMFARRCFASTSQGLVPVLYGPDKTEMGTVLDIADGAEDAEISIEYGAYSSRMLSKIHLVGPDGPIEEVCWEPKAEQSNVVIPIDVRLLVYPYGVRDWSGKAELDQGARLVMVDSWPPQVWPDGDTIVRWSATFPTVVGTSWTMPEAVKTFGFTVQGPPTGRVTIRAAALELSFELGDLKRDQWLFAKSRSGRVDVRTGVGGLTSLGVDAIVRKTTVPVSAIDGGHYVYTRCIDVSGEIAWSSPIWIAT